MWHEMKKKNLTCSISSCQAIHHEKCLIYLDADKLKALKKIGLVLIAKKNRRNNIVPERTSSAPGSDPQNTASHTNQLLLLAIKDLTEEVKVLKISLDANGSEIKDLKESLEKQASITFENAQ